MGLRANFSILEALTLLPPCAGCSGWRDYDLSFLEPAEAHRRLSRSGCGMRAAGERHPVRDHHLLRLGTRRAPTPAVGLRFPVPGKIPSGKASEAADFGLLFLRPGAVGQVALRLDPQRDGDSDYRRLSQRAMEVIQST